MQKGMQMPESLHLYSNTSHFGSIPLQLLDIWNIEQNVTHRSYYNS